MELKWILIISLILGIEAESPQYCYSTDKSPYNFFSVLSSYKISRPSEFKLPEKCSPVYMWALIRHGTRFVMNFEVPQIRSLIRLREEIISNHEKGRGKLCPTDLKNISDWKFPSFAAGLTPDLTSQGKRDQLFLAKQLKEKFPTLLGSPVRENFIIKSSEVKRTQESAIIFTNELLNTTHQTIKGHGIEEAQNFLHPSELCPRYTEEMWYNSITRQEFIKFIKSNKMKQVLEEVSQRLGFNYTLGFYDVSSMYISCAYENAWNDDSRPAFCAAFSEENLKVFEYSVDLDHFWRYGYTNTMYQKLGCPLARDIMLNLRDVSQNNSQHKATLYFSHSETIMPLTVKLGLNHDEIPLKHDNYDKMKDTRKWRLSRFNSFAANIIVVLYKCPEKEDENQVVIYQNEREAILPGCPGSPCSLKLMQKLFEDVFDEQKCNLDFCFKTSIVTESRGILISPGWVLCFTLLILLSIFL